MAFLKKIRNGMAPGKVQQSNMARSDLLLGLVKSGVDGDRNLFQRTVEAVIAEERAKQHNVLADQLEGAIRKNGKTFAHSPLNTNGSYNGLFYEVQPQRSLIELVLLPHVRIAIQELIEEQLRADVLRAHNVEPRHKLLLIGPPGNGKTTVAEAIAEGLGLPLLSVRYEGLVGSYLGETAARLQKLFDHVSTRACVLFFDEFDTLGKERGDIHDTGEIKRVVSSLLLQIDRLPSYVVVIGATNHQELLDRAVWRRFQVRIELPPPNSKQVSEWLSITSQRFGLPLDISPRILTQDIGIESFAELEDFVLDLLRRMVLNQGERPIPKIVAERIEQWKLRARSK